MHRRLALIVLVISTGFGTPAPAQERDAPTRMAPLPGIDTTGLTRTPERTRSREEVWINSSGPSSGAARVLTPLYMLYLQRYFEDVEEKSAIDRRVMDILDEPTRQFHVVGL